jgi:hypothetical protein
VNDWGAKERAAAKRNCDFWHGDAYEGCSDCEGYELALADAVRLLTDANVHHVFEGTRLRELIDAFLSRYTLPEELP